MLFRSGEQKYHCHYRYGHGELTMAEALEKSCNPYFINLGMQVGGEALCDMAYRMGFGSSAKLGEGVTAAAGVLPKGRDLWGGDLANFSFGQGEFTATPVQIAQMISAIANGGRFVSPTVYRGTTLNGGDLELREEPAPGAQIIKPSTAAAPHTMLIGDRKSTGLNSSRQERSRMPASA